MKVVFAALKFDYGIGKRGESLEARAFLPALQKNFETVSPFWLEDNGFPNDLNGLQGKLMSYVENENPDFVFFILMEYEILPETLTKLKERYKTINWFCDDAWRFESFTKTACNYFTHCITVDKYSLLKYLEIGFQNVILSQWATFDYENNFEHRTNEYKYDVSFIGGRNPNREWIVNYLKKRGINVACFGKGWENGRVSYDNIKQIFAQTKINLNLSNSVSKDIRFLSYLLIRLLVAFLKIPFKNPKKSLENLKFYLSSLKEYFVGKKRVETIKARNFEIPGCGGFQLSQFALEIEDYYQIGKEISVFATVEELVKQIKYYSHFDKEREAMRIRGYRRSREHTYNIRINRIFKSIIN